MLSQTGLDEHSGHMAWIGIFLGWQAVKHRVGTPNRD